MRLANLVRGVFDSEATLLTIFAAPMILSPYFISPSAFGQATSLIIIVYGLVLLSVQVERLLSSLRRLDDRLTGVDRDLEQLAGQLRWLERRRDD